MKRIILSGLLSVGLLVAAGPVAYAALTADSQLTQTINAGVLSTSIRDGSGAVVASPSFGMGAATVSTSLQTVTGTFGTASQRITVDNPGASATGFTLALAATGGASATWTDGAKTYPFNGASSATGQLSVDPSVGTLTAAAGTTTGITKGSPSTFSGGGNTPIQLLNAGASSDDVWNGYLTGVGLSQTIPASTPAGSYTISLTQTVAAQ
jgi:hypothetical protein